MKQHKQSMLGHFLIHTYKMSIPEAAEPLPRIKIASATKAMKTEISLPIGISLIFSCRLQSAQKPTEPISNQKKLWGLMKHSS